MSEILEKARQLLRESDLCHACLGHFFSTRGRGLTNRERGRAISTVLALEDHTPLTEPQDCWLCGGLFQTTDSWACRAYKKLSGIEFRTYLMGTRPPLEIDVKEKYLREKHDVQGEPFKQAFNREIGKRMGEMFAKEGHPVQVDFEHPDVVLLMDPAHDQLELQINPLFIYGRYRKLVRGIPQTHWPCRECGGRGCSRCGDTGKMYPESVQQLIEPVLVEAAQGEGGAFHGAGREDIDALMLGRGRPFVVEVKEPKRRQLNLEALACKINRSAAGKVEVGGLKAVRRSVVEQIKNEEAEKIYEAVVTFQNPVEPAQLAAVLRQLQGAEVSQQTPQRVLHRRADLVRRRRVLEVEGCLESRQQARLTIRCQGGLYIKELISGDEGRTQPSLGTLLCNAAQVAELTVLDVVGHFPD